MGEQREALTEESVGDDDDGGGAVTGSGVLGLGEIGGGGITIFLCFDGLSLVLLDFIFSQCCFTAH